MTTANPNQTTSSTPAFDPAVVLLILAAALWLGTLGFRDLVHPDEGRYASISLGMLMSGDWITPRLNGLLYFEKPILQYWAGALSFAVFGVNDFAARLWPGLTGLLSVLAVGHTGIRLWGRETGYAAAIVMGGSTWIVANSHFLTLDMGVSFFLAVALCGFLLAQHDGASLREQKRWMLIAWAAMAGATLSKGLIGIVIPGAVLVFYSLFARQLKIWARLHLLSGLALYFALTAPWFIAVSMKNPGFAHFFFIHEHVDRFLTNEHRREGALWYFVPILIIGFMPWTSLLPQTLREGWRRNPGEQFRPALMLLVWAGFIFLFFSKSNSKLPSYILPMFPALALLLGRVLTRIEASRLRWHIALPALAWIGIAALYPLAERFASDDSPLEMMRAFALIVSLTAIACLVIAIVAWNLSARGRKQEALLSLAVASLLFFTGIQLAHNELSPLRSARVAAAALAPSLKPETELYSVRYYDQTFPYYLRRNVTLVEYVDEFAFGEKTEPALWIPSLEAFIPRWKAATSAAAMMTEPTYQTLSAQGIPMQIVYRDARRLIVTKP